MMDILRVIINIVIVYNLYLSLQVEKARWRTLIDGTAEGGKTEKYFWFIIRVANPSGRKDSRATFYRHLVINCHSFIIQTAFSSFNGLLISSQPIKTHFTL